MLPCSRLGLVDHIFACCGRPYTKSVGIPQEPPYLFNVLLISQEGGPGDPYTLLTARIPPAAATNSSPAKLPWSQYYGRNCFNNLTFITMGGAQDSRGWR
eukprot:SAG31_NODE_16322_length_713_cov_1.420195_1_plen_99_part_10